MTMDDLEEMVVYDCCCSLDVFWENVSDAGWNKRKVREAVKECQSKKELRKLVCEFI